MLEGNVFYTGRRPFSAIIAETPAGKIPTFQIVKSHDDSDLERVVYYKDGKFHGVLDDELVEIETADQLKFWRYISLWALHLAMST